MKSFPTDDKTTFLLCEDFRSEQGGKSTLLGTFLGGDIIIQEEKKDNGALPSLAFIFTFTDGSGNFNSTIEVLSPDNKEVIVNPQPTPVEKKPGDTMNIMFKVAPFPVTEGTYSVSVLLDEKKYQRKFNIKFSPPQ